MPLHLVHRTPRPSGRVLLAHIRYRFLKTARQKALRERARALVADLLGAQVPVKKS